MGKNVDAAATIIFRWVGSPNTVRVIEPYTWELANEFTQAVNLELAANLLVYPIEGEFVPVAGQEVSKQTLQQLAELCGGTVDEVQALLGRKSVGDETVGD